MIREINSNDRIIIYDILNKEFDTIYKEDSPFTKWIIYEEHNTIIGFINYDSIYDHSELEYIYVIPEYRKKGIATMLLNKMIDNLDKDNIKNISLEVKDNNEKAIKFYEKNGFKKVTIRKNYYKNNDAFLMLKSW